MFSASPSDGITGDKINKLTVPSKTPTFKRHQSIIPTFACREISLSDKTCFGLLGGNSKTRLNNVLFENNPKNL